MPVLTTLAREFAVCDAWFSSLPGPTWPNRFFVHAASSGGLDDSPSALDVLVHEVGAGFEFENGTIYDRLGDDWLVFHGDEFPHVFSIKGMLAERLAGRFQPQSRFEAMVSHPGFSAKYVFIEPYCITPEIAARSPIAERFLRISTRVQAMRFFEDVRKQVGQPG